MNSPQLLIVEDNLALGELLRDVLGAFGFDVLVASNAPEALTLLAAHDIDAVVADVELPRMSGLEFCRAARQRELALGRELPIWLMTGAHDPELERAAQLAGAHAVLQKPFSIAQLGAQLQRAIRRGPAVAATQPA
jgi:CheY-like chemotaxis protein